MTKIEKTALTERVRELLTHAGCMEIRDLVGYTRATRAQIRAALVALGAHARRFGAWEPPLPGATWTPHGIVMARADFPEQFETYSLREWRTPGLKG